MEYGLELDDVTTEKAIIRKEKHLDGVEDDESTEDEDVLYKIEVPANRYKSFIDLQDKLHQNICRRRTLVAIGTHDLDTLQGPFTYEALSPEEINFVPLKQEKSFRADELMELYKSDMKLKFLHIIEDSPVYPVIYDSNRTVLSLPPIINGARSAITLRTKNVFIECTATDLTKAKIVLNTMVSMFSVYCERKFEVEPVEVICSDAQSCIYPYLSSFDMEVPLAKITGRIGVSLDASQVTSLLTKMQLHGEEISSGEESIIRVSLPPTRSDVLEACDVAEDVAIAYGFNNIPRTQPVLSTQGRQQPLTQLGNLIRLEIASAGFTEVLTWILCSNEENFSMLNRKDDKTSVTVANPRSSDFEATRTSLMSGLLKTVRENNHHPKPIKIFEMGDVVLLDDTKDVGAKNSRKVAALYCNQSSGYEEINGLVQKIMQIVDVPWIEDPQVGDNNGYLIAASKEKETEDTAFLPGRQASIILNGKQVGTLGIVHPKVLGNFDINFPCSYMEMDVECFL
ncbi:phenylalanine--tRNA ligase beta subunit, cytoplasmic-like isoform X2 [Papaver somniferum]|uniref:phenylalanine--tRNA ligase beta subunit, cytoplasmic-like isoform X2 n=1 Tax=Papaver somniferum TaxID=3469 RepID=UPI000E700243|nr:phenylalanine--tRNA ligase beta subunit, cytoplasmic-like isoform X2 [Papaver somniferum]